MEGTEEDDGYSDDDLDTLPVHAFQELQQNAIRSTQQPQVHEQGQMPYPALVVVANGRLGISEQPSIAANGNNYTHQPSSDYGDFDGEMLDGEIFDATEQQSILLGESKPLRVADENAYMEPWTQREYGGPSAGAVLQKTHRAAVGHSGTQLQAFGQTGGRGQVGSLVAPKPGHVPVKAVEQSTDDESLQAKIEEVKTSLVLRPFNTDALHSSFVQINCSREKSMWQRARPRRKPARSL